MRTIRYSEIDLFFSPFAKSKGLAIYTQAKDEETRVVRYVDHRGHEFELWAVPEYRQDMSEVNVGATLIKRGDKKHTFYRERKHYEFRASVPLVDLGEALASAWAAVQGWSNSIGRGGNA